MEKARSPSCEKAIKEQETERSPILSILADDLAMESAVSFPRMIEVVPGLQKGIGDR